MEFSFNFASIIPFALLLVALVVGFFKIRTIIQNDDTKKTIHIVHDELRKNESRYNEKLLTLIDSRVQPHCETQRLSCKDDFNRIHDRLNTVIVTVNKSNPNGKIIKIETSLKELREDFKEWKNQVANR